MQNRGSQVNIKKNKIGLIALYLVALAVLVTAAIPSVPSIIGPLNNSVYFGGENVTLICSGSTDDDGGPITYIYNISPEPNRYYFSSFTYNYEDARDYCEALGTDWHLATIDNSTEQTYISSIVNSGNAWIGLRDVDGDGSYEDDEWEWGTSGYRDWSGGEGSDPSQCVWHQASDDNWADSPCTDTAKFVCEFGNYSYTSYEQNGINASIYSLCAGNYNWSCKACNSTPNCSESSEIMNLGIANIYNCNSGNINLNFTLFNEEIYNDTLNASWDITLSLSSETSSDSFNFQVDNTFNPMFCIEPNGTTITLNGFVEYLPTNESYSYPRQYYFSDASITSGIQTDIIVHALEDGYASSCSFKVTEEGSTPYAGSIIHLQRYLPGTGAYLGVAMGNTSSGGEDTIYLRLTDAWYRIFAYDRNNVLRYTSGPEHIASCPYNIIIGSEGEPDYNESEEWFLYDNINFAITFNDTTNLTSLTYDDPTGYATKMCLRVEKFGFEGDGYDLINTTCLTSSSGTMIQHLNESGFYIAKAIGYHNDDWRLLGSLSIELGENLSNLIGKEGVFFAFLLVGILIFVGLYSPPASIIMGIVGFIASKAFGLLEVGWGAIVGIAFVGVLILFKQRGR